MPDLYPLKFEPIFKSMLWGGNRLPGFLRLTPATQEPIGEAWVLSDVSDNHSVVANGAFAGRTLRTVIEEFPQELFGTRMPPDGRFPLLLKFIDARRELSVQVHPDDELARQHHGDGHRGKTEAWVILDANPETSRIYAGFNPGTTAEGFREAMAARTVPDTLHTFTPKPGDCVFLEAGTVHAIGADILLFEVQQTSDITYRLYDWDRVDAKTGLPRALHIEAGLASSDFERGPCHPVEPVALGDRELIVDCEYFTLHHWNGDKPVSVGAPGECRVLVCIGGAGRLGTMELAVGDVVLLPAVSGRAIVEPLPAIRFLECGLGQP